MDGLALQELEVARRRRPQGYRWLHHVNACWGDSPPPCESLDELSVGRACRYPPMKLQRD
jgi:hypothetical protein